MKEIRLDEDVALLTRKVIASYVMGFDAIILKGHRIDADTRTRIFQIVEGLMGLEVVREDSQSIEIRQMLDSKQLTITSALSRLAHLAKSMMKDLPEAISKADEGVLRDLITRESHADGIHWFIARQINYAILDHGFAKSIELDIGLATCYLSAARNIERICDHIENVAKHAVNLGPGPYADTLVALARSCSDIFSRSARAFVRRSIEDAEKILAEADEHKERYAISTFADLSRTPDRGRRAIPMLIAESLHRIMSYSQDIAELTVDVVLSK